jgi:hypothetical protein
MTLDGIDFTFCSATVDRTEPESLIHEFMTLTRLKIDCIRYEGAAVFAKSATFKAFCVNNRIAMEETAAYTHTFNARAEGAVRIVKEHMRCLLRRANPPTSLLAVCNAALLPRLRLLARQARQKCMGEIGCSWAACALPR